MRTTCATLCTLMLIGFTASTTSAQDFYYCGDSIYTVTVSNSKITVQFHSPLPSFDMGTFLASNGCLNDSVPPVELEQDCVSFSLAGGCSYATAAAAITSDPDVRRVFPVYVFQSGNADFAVTDLVSVQFNESLPLSACENILSSFGLHRIDSSQFRHNYWWCALDDTISDSPLPYGNWLHVLPDVEWASATMYAQAEFQSELSDPYFQFQYYLKNVGQSGGAVDADIDADLAWDVTKGGVQVAILDDGWSAHPDLPSPRVLGVWNVGDWNPDDGPPMGNPDASPDSTANHGMACAGIISAAHNGIGVAGICPECDIVGIRISRSTDNRINRISRALANAIYLAYALGADVLSNSWSYGDTDPITDVSEAIKYVTSPCQPFGGWHGGVAVIFSAGNYADKAIGPDLVAFPANMKETISAGAIDKNNIRWAYSCYGDNLDVVTPTGQDAIAGIPSGDVWTDDQTGDLGWNPLITGAGDASGDVDYTSNMGGTSASCAMVAGITALLLSRRPDLLDGCAPYETLRDVLTGSAVDLGDPGKDPLYGAGRANAYRALLAVIRGDVNNDGVLDALDLNQLIDMLFFGGSATLDPRTADIDCSGFNDALDLNDLIDCLFFDGPAPRICFEY